MVIPIIPSSTAFSNLGFRNLFNKMWFKFKDSPKIRPLPWADRICNQLNAALLDNIMQQACL